VTHHLFLVLASGRCVESKNNNSQKMKGYIEVRLILLSEVSEFMSLFVHYIT
jgi:hypothetical protein